MYSCLRLEILTEDRIGMALDILKEIFAINISVTSTEVFLKKVYIKIDKIDENKKDILIRNIRNLNGVLNIKEIKLMPSEEHERRILAFIDSVEEGIIAINKTGQIEIFNNYCEKIFNYTKEELVGKHITKLLSSDAPIISLIKEGQSYNNLEMKIKTKRGESHYLTTGRAIKDDYGNILGAVASIKDINKVIELANIVSNTDESVFKDVIGNSIEINKIKELIKAISSGNSIVLLRGESGTGKEVFAKSIHLLSKRSDKPFVPVNCAALPEQLLESELFGYEEGSFTGALKGGKKGLFKEAQGGTIFLDEIGELSMVLQAKLLRVLQEGKIRRIGSSEEEDIDVRIITATNKNLEKMIKDGTFREDLYYRLNVIPVYLPPLRSRKEDIPLLVNFFIDKLNKKLGKKIIGFDMKFINKLMEYEWPGNIRELENVVERAMNLCDEKILKCKDLMIDFTNGIIENNKNKSLGVDLFLSDVVELAEKEAILEALKKYNTIRKSAKALGVSHTTLVNKIRKYDIKWK
ncbi:sigma 54-interacting transcriptional regulator [Alkalithermobacter paradoxus]|uniref:HTH-type transcriptional regulatory protein TyrR n=1 Tax=Alkalithermobacter paradoxus TaxID=29349 RepID=A0A1V4IA83_9FIRM|nr:transcriptional regulatory protein TyrR [[Clostridium] thermoalcaliphilum]